MRYLATILITLLLATPAMSVELFRYRGAAMDGGTLEYIFETDEQDVPKTVSKEKAAVGVDQGCLKRCKIRATVAPCQTKRIKCLSRYGAIFWKGN